MNRVLALILLTFFLCGWEGGWQQDQVVNNLYTTGHIYTYQNPPTVSSCGGGGVLAKSSDIAGQVVMTGNTTVTSCKLSFGQSYYNNPFCMAFNAGRSTPVIHATADTTGIYMSADTTMTGSTVTYNCIGGI